MTFVCNPMHDADEDWRSARCKGELQELIVFQNAALDVPQLPSNLKWSFYCYVYQYSGYHSFQQALRGSLHSQQVRTGWRCHMYRDRTR